ncbi:hypothetical protein ILYODFUR_009934, partial [Ilyodon furcidens]
SFGKWELNRGGTVWGVRVASCLEIKRLLLSVQRSAGDWINFFRCRGGNGGGAMPFLHGFRRIIYEYQPLVNAVMRVVGIEEKEGGNESSLEEDSSRCSSLVALLEQESQSEVFLEGISYALFKVAERGLVNAANILLRYGADINFE